jgi:TM2 domain-containing membrane protein YozV
MERNTVVGVFADRAAAEEAVTALEGAGFTNEHIGFAGHGEPTAQGAAREGADHAGGALKGAAGGSVTGGVVGGILGALATALIPGIGPVIAGGLLAGVVAGAVAGGAIGGLTGALTGMGVSKEDAEYYEQEFRGGRTLVTVDAGNRRAEAEAIMREHGAHDAANRKMVDDSMRRR